MVVFFNHTSCEISSSFWCLRQTEVLAVLLRFEAVLVAAAAAVPEASTATLLVVKEPHYDVVLAAAGVAPEQTSIWMKEGESDCCVILGMSFISLV